MEKERKADFLIVFKGENYFGFLFIENPFFQILLYSLKCK